MSKVQLALTLVVGIVIGCLLPKKDFFCQDLAVYPADPANSAPCPVCQAVAPDPVSAPALPDVEMPSMDPVAPAAPTPVRPALSMDSLVAHVQHLKEPLEQIRREVGDEDCSVAPLDGAALLGLADLTKVDLILESGTAGGRSAELMARFFNQSVQIVTVDWGDIGDGGRCGKRVEDAHKRLKNFANVKALIGDSFKIFPELIAQHPGKRIGLFIDGPKEMLAVKLCIQSLKASNSIQYCIFHDMVKKKKNPAYQKTLKYLRSWHRLVGLCCCDQRWVTALGGPASMGIVAGSAIIPFGPGDTIPPE